MNRPLARAVVLCLLAGAACGESPAGPPSSGPARIGGSQSPAVGLTAVAAGFAGPLFLTSPPGDLSRLFVVERAGTIRIIKNGKRLSRPFLSISSVSTADGGGLFSMAFHPNYATNGRFFVYFTNTAGELKLREYKVSSQPNRAKSGSGRTLITIPKPAGTHLGGQVTFGPDGYLYLAFGDGGDLDLFVDNAQDPGTLLGKMIRIDVDNGRPYRIPPDNPYRNDPNVRDEIWAFGLRNPWRYSFDTFSGELYIADVGQAAWEEVDVAGSHIGGLNYGWPIMEGNSCFDPPVGCDSSGLTMPVFQYDHSLGCSIAGGYVYRGAAMPSFDGVYFYSDFCAGGLRSFRVVGGSTTEHVQWDVGDVGGVFSFGQDAAGELYVLSRNGTVYRLVQTG